MWGSVLVRPNNPTSEYPNRVNLSHWNLACLVGSVVSQRSKLLNFLWFLLWILAVSPMYKRVQLHVVIGGGNQE